MVNFVVKISIMKCPNFIGTGFSNYFYLGKYLRMSKENIQKKVEIGRNFMLH